MGLIVKQSGERTKLQEKITAELREKSMKTAQIDTTPPDFAEDIAYKKDLKSEKEVSSTWFWVFVAIVIVVIITFFAFVR
jgi:hypothetical protein